MAPYTLVDGRDGFLGQGTFGVVEKVVENSTGEVMSFAMALANCADNPITIGLCLQDDSLPRRREAPRAS